MHLTPYFLINITLVTALILEQFNLTVKEILL